MTFYITTAINYTNGPPHIGHLFEIVLADVITRYYRYFKNSVYFLTGTDEHGQKIEKTANLLQKTPIEICDQFSKQFQTLNTKMMIFPTYFIRTTDQKHISRVKQFYLKCKPDIYKGEYNGWYNVREESFVTDIEAKKNDYIDKISGKKLLKIKESTHYFKLSKYQSQIKIWLENNNIIYPPSKKMEILQRLNEPLTDLCISRPKNRSSWGISVPEDEDYTLYVWFDALINYVSANEYDWPVDIHIIGKDILWFHSVIWPAMLLSAEMKLPKKIFVHNFVTDSNGIKMSKSLGNIIEPQELFSKFPISTIRFYLIRSFNYEGDLKWNNEKVINIHNTELLSKFGNLVSRATSLVVKYNDKIIPAVKSEILFSVEMIISNIERKLNNFRLDLIIEEILHWINVLNKYLTDEKPWNYKVPQNKKNKIMRTVLDGIFILSHLLLPILPDITEKIFIMLKTPPISQFNKLRWNVLPLGGNIRINQKLKLFHPLNKKHFIVNASDNSDDSL